MLSSILSFFKSVGLVLDWLKERSIRQEERDKIDAEQESNAKDAKIIRLTPKSIIDKLRYLKRK